MLFGKIKENENITLLLNTSCLDAECLGNTITSITAWQLTTYSWHKVSAKYFADCSGDSVLALLSGAKYRIGREGNEEFNETIGPKIADSKTMGMSILLQAKETDHPVKFIPPEWANVYKTDEDIDIKANNVKYSETRSHEIGTSGCNLWWMELGGDHNPKGFKANAIDDKASVLYPAPSPYGIPYRCLYSQNIENLFCAGRNISATHAAMSSTRVMGTCSLLGQAMGTAASICFKNNLKPGELKCEYITLLQKKLMDDGVFIPFTTRPISSVTTKASINLSESDKEVLFNGIERPRFENDEGNTHYFGGCFCLKTHIIF